MIKNEFLRVVIIIFVSASSLFAFGERDKNAQAVQVTGRVRLVGSSPGYMLVITGENREWYIEQKEQEKLMELQQQLVTVIGNEYYKDLIFANGMSAGRRYYLKNIKIIKLDV
jgi:hypothetical protein